MKHFVPLDPDGNASSQHWAVVYVPKRTRNRFPASCVTTVANRDEALAQADIAARKFPASVIGPSKSSEGQFIYYLQSWLASKP